MKFKKLLQLCFKKTFQFLFKLIYGKIKLNIDSNKIKNLYKKQILDINSDIEDSKNYYSYKIINGRVYTDYVEHVAIISKNDLIGEISYQQVLGDLKNASRNIVLSKGTPRFKIKFKGKVLCILQGASGNNYGHWLLDMLPKIKLCSEHYSLNDINYFYTPNLANFQKETLSVLGISENRIINSEKFRHIQAEELLVVDHPNYYKGFILEQNKFQPTWTIQWLRDTYLIYKKKFNANKKIFIDRTDSISKHCHIQNEEEVFNYLKNKGFSKYQLTKLSFFEKIYLFENAEIIVGAHGAGLTNLVFCKPKTKVIEIRPSINFNTVYERISYINNLNYRLIQTKKLDKNQEKLGDIYLSINELEHSIKSFN
jgi:capsular polysaccharide biosynthesis protein|tara:strand:+ start:2834 stop:3940 length:1107 start_codon:yes stop_codon:yes gene_type:complete